jgi:hypothetical protein
VQVPDDEVDRILDEAGLSGVDDGIDALIPED